MKKGAPVDFGLTVGDAYPQDSSLAFRIDGNGDKDRAIAEVAIVADFFVAGIHEQIGTGTKGAFAPLFELRIQEFGARADLG